MFFLMQLFQISNTYILSKLLLLLYLLFLYIIIYFYYSFILLYNYYYYYRIAILLQRYKTNFKRTRTVFGGIDEDILHKTFVSMFKNARKVFNRKMRMDEKLRTRLKIISNLSHSITIFDVKKAFHFTSIKIII